MSRADDIAARFRSAAPKLAEAFHADAYEISRGYDRVPDGAGGYTETPNVVESGLCLLDATGRLGSEAIRGSVPTSVTPYTAELPIDSTITETDTITINDRAFDVVDVARGGASELFTRVGLEERDA